MTGEQAVLLIHARPSSETSMVAFSSTLATLLCSPTAKGGTTATVTATRPVTSRFPNILDGWFPLCRCSLRPYASRIAGASSYSISGFSSITPSEGSPREEAAPNHILFIENLPHETTSMMLQILFQQYPGFKEVRMIEAKPGIAFVEFEDDMQAFIPMQALQGFKITPQNPMAIVYAKK